jgi:hypothetical protein
MDISVKQAGQRGGNKTLFKYGVDHFTRISKLGVQTRQNIRQIKTPQKVIASK